MLTLNCGVSWVTADVVEEQSMYRGDNSFYEVEACKTCSGIAGKCSDISDSIRGIFKEKN